jgi:hypothetical protein
MRQKPPPFIVFSLLAGLILVALSLYGFFLLRSRPGLPDEIRAQDVVQIDNFGIQKPMVSYFSYNEKSRAVQLIDRLLTGQSIALVSDAGTPALNDPGVELVQKVIGPQWN